MQTILAGQGGPRHGHAVRVVQPVDVFPQTFHVETVTLIELT